MSDDIEIPEVYTDDIVDASDQETSVAGTVAIVAAGVAAGLGLGYGIQKLSKKIGDKMYDNIVASHRGDNTVEDCTEPDSEE